jgi:uncharacterized membrane protein
MSDQNNQNNGDPFKQASDFINNTADETHNYDAQDIEQNKVVSGLAYLGILFFLPLVVCPNSKFGKFHANQGITLFFVYLAIGVINVVFGFVPFFGWYIGKVLYLAAFVLMILGMVNAFSGKAKELPIIGQARILK